MTNPNQKLVEMPNRKLTKDQLFSILVIEEHEKASRELTHSGLRLWGYISKNRPGFKLALSMVDAQKWGLPKNSYHRAVKELVEKGYLCQKSENSNIYQFRPGAKEIKEETVEVIADIASPTEEETRAPEEIQKDMEKKSRTGDFNF